MKIKRSFVLVVAAAALATAGAGTAMATDHAPTRADRPAQHATVQPADPDAAGIDDVDAPGTEVGAAVEPFEHVVQDGPGRGDVDAPGTEVGAAVEPFEHVVQDGPNPTDDVDAPAVDEVLPDCPRVDVGLDGISRADV